MSTGRSAEIVEAVAVIGMDGRFPGARTIAEFWQNLRDGVESISVFSDAKLRDMGVDPALLNNPQYVKAGGVIEGADLFDAGFFKLSPREAQSMDPQHRLFLECAWHALEDAAYDPDTYEGSIGVYAGSGWNTYLPYVQASPDLIRSLGAFHIMLNNDKDHLTTRASYKLNLKGPSVNVQTACSTSLVAVAMACQSLLDHECDLALAGGVGVKVPQEIGYLYQPGGISSPDGHCRPFDARAQGIVGGNGVALVVLKRLSEAVADRDHIYAVIKGVAINNDGSLKVGYTAPSIEGQAEVIAMAHALAGVEPGSIQLIEAHGTATPLGDPIEIAALTQAFESAGIPRASCAIGSVKSNIGHLDSAAGVAGLIKIILALQHRMMPPSLHFHTPNSKIDFARSPFYVIDHLAEWKSDGTPRRAAVSSFGMGGTNAHVVLEEAPEIEPSGPSRSWQVLTISARTRSALDAATTNLCHHLESCPDLSLADLAYTSHVGRHAFAHRRIVVGRGHLEAVRALRALDAKWTATSNGEARGRPVIFLFPGQGAQHVRMAAGLYEHEPLFRETVDRCADLLTGELPGDLRSVIYPADRDQGAEERLRRTEWAQPALFVVEYALARLWMAWGIVPAAMIGHSIGEYVAACLADVLSLEDALALVAARARLMQRQPAGKMLAVALSEGEVRTLAPPHLSIAAINGPALCVVSGPVEPVDEFEARLRARGVASRQLATSHAFHSSMMAPVVEPFVERVRKVELSPPKIPYVANATGRWVTDALAIDAIAWGRHLVDPVRFHEGLLQLRDEGEWVWLEVGPGQTLSRLVTQIVDGDGRAVVSSLGAATQHDADTASTLGAIGRLWTLGQPVAWSAFHAHERRRRVALPLYPFERQSYWIHPSPPPTAEQTQESLLARNPDVAGWFFVPSWRRSEPVRISKPGTCDTPWKCCLLFEGNAWFSAALRTRLLKRGTRVVTVRPGQGFTFTEDEEVTMDPTNPEDYGRLLDALAARDLRPRHIVHCWNVTGAEPNLTLYDWLNFGFYSLLYLAQQLGRQGETDEIHLTVISDQLHAVTGEEPICPEKATLIGPCRVIPKEYPYIRCRSIDVLLPTGSEAAETDLVERVLAEADLVSTDVLIAYRGRHRWVPQLEPVQLTEEARDEGSRRLRSGGVYLITGGLGGIGLVVAHYLAATFQAKLALVGRRIPPPASEWPQWLDGHDPQHPLSQTITRLKAIEDAGGELALFSADVADEQQMREVVAEVRRRFGTIHGVLHTAGVAGGGIIQLKTPDIAESVMAPKIVGTQVLTRLLSDVELDWFVLCSSLASMLGPLGQVDYCAANAFLDAYAQATAGSRAQVVAVNWDTWREVGMAVNTPVPPELEAMRRHFVEKGINSAEGVDAFLRALGAGMPQLAVSTTYLPLVLELAKTEASTRPVAEEGALSEARPSHERPELANAYESPRNELEQKLAEIWQILLGVNRIGIGDNFFELGGHSLLAIQMISRVRDATGLTLAINDVFEAPTIARLAETIASGLSDADDRGPSIVPLPRDEYRARVGPDGVLRRTEGKDGSS